MKIVDAINSINQDVWGVALIILGGVLLVVTMLIHPDHIEAIIGAIGSILGAGAMAFKGGTKS